MNLEAFLGQLQGVRRNARGWKARCPAHADGNPSLSVTENAGKILLKCFGGCTVDAILAALQMDAKELFSHAPQRKQKPQIVATYDYTDEHGNLQYQNVRYEPKDFRLRSPDGNGGWVWSVESSYRTIYNLPAVITTTDVIWTEGEKDSDTAKTLGFTATTSSGASSWQEHFSEYLKGKRVTIIADADEPGRKHARQVARSLRWITGGGTQPVLESVHGDTALAPGCATLLRVVHSCFEVVGRSFA